MRSPALLSLLALLPSAEAAAGARHEYRPDGSVVVDGRHYATTADYFADPGLAAGRRCGAHAPPPIASAGAVFAAPGDCTLERSTIKPEYGADDDLVIQVMFHVIAKRDGTGRLGPDRIASQIAVLNQDYAPLHVSFVPARFSPTGAPLATPGYELVESDAYFADPGAGAAANPMKEALHWDTKRYLNFYTNDAGGGGILGYATFPQESAGTALDGIVLLFSSVGVNPAAPPYDLGKTATHEVGHYLGLLHTFQDGCGSPGSPYTSGDLLADTVPEAEAHTGCAPVASGCPGAAPAPLENFMDYADDRCMTTFSREQIVRARCSLVNYRHPNTLPTAVFQARRHGTEIELLSSSSDGEATKAQLQHRWDFGDGSPVSTEVSPRHRYAAPGTYTVRLDVVDPESAVASATATVKVGVGEDDDDAVTGGCSAGGATRLPLFAIALLVLGRRRRVYSRR